MYTIEKWRVTGRGNLELIRTLKVEKIQFAKAICLHKPVDGFYHYTFTTQQGMDFLIKSANPHLFD